MFLEECKYVVKEEKKSNFITDDIKISSEDSDKENSDEENANGKIKYMFFFFFLRKYKSPPKISEYLNLRAEDISKFSFLKYKKFFWVSVS